MKKYLAIFHNESGQWTSSPLSQIYIFEAKDDAEALQVVVAKENTTIYKINFLACITGGLKVEAIDLPDVIRVDKKFTFTSDKQGEMGFQSIYPDKSVISQLQPFDPRVRQRRLRAIAYSKKKDQTDGKKIASIPVPKVSQDIYVPSEFYLSHGRDDKIGGLAKVVSVAARKSNGKKTIFICVKEFPEMTYSWNCLALQQDKLKKHFGSKRARHDPDFRPEFNED